MCSKRKLRGATKKEQRAPRSRDVAAASVTQTGSEPLSLALVAILHLALLRPWVQPKASFAGVVSQPSAPIVMVDLPPSRKLAASRKPRPKYEAAGRVPVPDPLGATEVLPLVLRSRWRRCCSRMWGHGLFRQWRRWRERSRKM